MNATEMSAKLAAELHREAMDRYLQSIKPIINAKCELERMMPLTFLKRPDGSLEKLEKHNWPKWALDYSDQLDLCLESIRDEAFNGFRDEVFNGLLPDQKK